MIKRRVLVNLAVFAAVTVALVAYGLVDLLGDPLRSPMLVSAVFPNASGIHSHFAVTLNGVDVGFVRSVQLVPNGARVTMAVQPGTTVPGDVTARIGLANALGEQQIELVPRRGGTAPPLSAGATVPVDPNGIPTDVGQVVSTATRLLQAIPVGDLNVVLSELSTALRGRAGDIRTIIEASQVFAQEMLAYDQQFRALLANAPPVLDAVASVGPALRDSLANTAALTQLLASRRFDLVGLLDNGSRAATTLEALLGPERPNLACLLHDGAELVANLAAPTNLSNLSSGLATNGYFFGAVDSVSPSGAAASLYAGDQARADQEWLRTRLLIPPASPSADAYRQPTALPPTRPGAGCDTEFGPGVGPASQPVAPLAVQGSSLSSPTPAEAQVRGGGPLPPPPPDQQHAAFRRPAPSAPLGALGALVGLGLALGLPARLVPTDRRRRRRTTALTARRLPPSGARSSAARRDP
jgi:virulence factor Mce-like protein